MDAPSRWGRSRGLQSIEFRIGSTAKIAQKMDARSLLDEKVTSVLCSDEHGLCLGTQGPIDGARTAGLFHSIARRASSLSPHMEAPIVLIETDARDVIVKDYDNLTVTVVTKGGERR